MLFAGSFWDAVSACRQKDVQELPVSRGTWRGKESNPEHFLFLQVLWWILLLAWCPATSRQFSSIAKSSSISNSLVRANQAYWHSEKVRNGQLQILILYDTYKPRCSKCFMFQQESLQPKDLHQGKGLYCSSHYNSLDVNIFITSIAMWSVWEGLYSFSNLITAFIVITSKSLSPCNIWKDHTVVRASNRPAPQYQEDETVRSVSRSLLQCRWLALCGKGRYQPLEVWIAMVHACMVNQIGASRLHQ
jgi:hypothetical protein